MIVIDCAAVIDALSGLADTEELRSFIVDEDLHAPSLLDYEIVAAVRGMTLCGHFTSARAHDLLNDYDDLSVRIWPSVHALRHRAFQLRDKVSACDATYVGLAEALDCPLLTRDARLARSNGHEASIVLR